MGLLIIQALVVLASRFNSLKFIKNSDALQEISGMKLADRVLYEIAFACDFVPELVANSFNALSVGTSLRRRRRRCKGGENCAIALILSFSFSRDDRNEYFNHDLERSV